NTMLSLAFNYNATDVDTFNPETTSLGKVRRLEEGLPKYRTTFTVSQSWDDFDMFLRLNYFGEYFATHADDASDWGSTVADSAITIDAQGSYTINENLKLSVGAKNLFDQEAERLNPNGAGDPNGGCCGGVYYESGPFDYMGAYYYASLTYSY
ncbi:MAG: iron complex outermembrane receptor protein, partial [Enterobacterales bacterium]